jgi:hypothetical protein
MRSIAEHLQRIRRAALLKDLQALAWILYAGVLLIMLVAIAVEAIFHLSAPARLGIWQALAILGTAGGFVLIAVGGLIFSNRIDRYRWSTLARRVGALAFTKEDTVVNALQLERSLPQSTSRALSQAFIERVSRQLEQLNLQTLFPAAPIQRWKRLALTILVGFCLGILLTWEASSGAVYRWAHPSTEFPVPKPFALRSLTGDIHLLGGETATIAIAAQGAQPDSVFLVLVPPDSIPRNAPHPVPIRLSAAPDTTGQYRFAITEVHSDYDYRAYVPARRFWQAWKEVSTPTYRILVTDRPAMEAFSITVIPPAYSGLPPQTQAGNQANVQGLKGSTIAVRLTSNRPLKKSYIQLNDQELPLNTRGHQADGEFTLTDDGVFTVHLIDRRGITNRDPIPYHLQVLPDLDPDLTVLAPPPVVELGSDQRIPLQLKIEDDFGFSKLQVGYEIRRPSYLQVEPFISIFSIPIPDPHQLSQEITTVWDLSDLGLMPEDEVHYHFELYDNDDVSGPKQTLSGNFIARLPSLADLYATLETGEQEVMDDTQLNVEELAKIQEHLEKAQLDLLKSDRLDWTQQQEIKQTLKKAETEVERLRELAERLESLAEMGEKHGLFRPELMEKFKELQKLVNELISEDLLKDMEWVRKALEEMDLQELMSAVENLAQNVDQLERDLDRFLDIFRRIQAEQKLDEALKRLEQLTEQQTALDDRIRQTDEETDPSTFARLSQEEQWNLEEFQNIQEVMEEAAELMEPYHTRSAEALEELSTSDLAQQTRSELSAAMNQLRRQQSQAAQSSSRAALQDLESLTALAQEIQDRFMQATAAEMAARFQTVMRDVLTLSKAQEALQNTTAATPRNSPRMRDLAAQQQMLKDQLSQVMRTLLDLARETFAVTPAMGKALGMAFAQMEAAKNQLAERNSGSARNSQEQAMAALNEAAQAIYNAAQQMQMGGSASGFEQFLQRMQQMAGQQQGINNQGLQLLLGQMAASVREAMLQRLLRQQQQVRKSLQQLLDEMQQTGQQGLGDLRGIAEDMDEVIRELQSKQYTRKTVERQQRILSRMLDSQKSLTRRGFKEERISRTAERPLPYSGPAGLPEDLGQRRNLVLEALNQAMKAGYSRDYQSMIRRYFNILTQAEFEPPVPEEENPEEPPSDHE